MPASTPEGVIPLFLRGTTAEKYGLKNGPGVMDLVPYSHVDKDDILREIQKLGVMSDFEPGKKLFEQSNCSRLLIVVDPEAKFGEIFLIYFTDVSQNEFFEDLQRRIAENEMEKVVENVESNIICDVKYIDKPMTPRPWVNRPETDSEIKLLTSKPIREVSTVEILRPRRQLRQNIRLSDRKSEVLEFRTYKDPAFKTIKENDIAIQVTPEFSESSSQTTWFRSINKAVQYEASSVSSISGNESIHNLLAFLERATIIIERALQQNETIDIYHEAFRLSDDFENVEGNQAENELREIKNFADPNFSKSKSLSCIDWMPKSQGIVAVSAVRNITFDQRVVTSGQNNTSYILLWDFRQLVKPIVLLQNQQEIFKFRFNKTMPNIIVGGCITGQVVLWDLSDTMSSALKKNYRSQNNSEEEDDLFHHPIHPKYISLTEHSHRKCVSDLFWLPPSTQINHKGQLVGREHLSEQSHQFITVGGDGFILVWDIRFEKIACDDLRHIGRMRHVPTEKVTKDGTAKPLWAPIFRAQLKRLEGVGELSLCNISSVSTDVSSHGSDPRSQFLMTSEEGDIIIADLSSKKSEVTANRDDEDEDGDNGKDFIKWISTDHPRPTVALQQSPFFPDVFLSVGDWNFNIWKVGEDRPIFRSPLSSSYLTTGAWSPTRPAVIIVASSDGQLLAWDFTDSSFKPSMELKATHSKITSMEFLQPASLGTQGTRQQLLAVGDETGTLHIFETPRNVARPVHKEETVMSIFLDREIQVC